MLSTRPIFQKTRALSPTIRRDITGTSTNQQYHFETEGGTNGYAFIPVALGNDPFTLEYDINISSIEKDGAVRFGVTSTDMDISKAANVLGIFDNGQYGMLMGLQVIDQSNHKYEINSHVQQLLRSAEGL